ncbi:hypothetical protein [Celeribacter ethanolicus]|uniref:hypothetical protein n=1 Tax=Celeribacter ethanolicus TaxID=1758178 RepID=UPI0008319F66|nr:hypothetical protein [Celeribacter ethanolicus]
MLTFFFKPRDSGEMPRATEISDRWHVPQFSKIFDARVRETRVAMLIACPEPLFENHPPDPARIDALAEEIERIVRAKWTSREAERVTRFFGADETTSFVAVLEHTAIGAYAAPEQRVKAYYEFDGTRIGNLVPRGRAFDDTSAAQCVTL